MTYFDTNILVYFTIDQGDEKLQLARTLIFDAIKNDTFFISPLVLSEYIFVLSKLKILSHHDDKILLFLKHTKSNIDTKTIEDAYLLCKKIDFCKNINDCIHLKIAQKYCKKLVTFDKDFKKMQKYTNIKLDVLL